MTEAPKVKLAVINPDCAYCKAAERVLQQHQQIMQKAVSKVRVLQNRINELEKSG